MTERSRFELTVVASGRWLMLRVEAVNAEAALACAVRVLGPATLVEATLVAATTAATPGMSAFLSRSPL